MKTLFAAAALALAPSAAGASQAQDAQVHAEPANNAAAASLPDANPAIWVVRDEDTIVYLFGTFHMLDGRPWFIVSGGADRMFTLLPSP